MKVLLVAFISVASLCGCSEPPHPSDDELLKTFYAHQGEFETLVTMSREDTVTMDRIDPSFLRPENGIGQERWDQYRDLFKKLGLTRGIGLPINPGKPIQFIASARGYVVGGGSDKGYIYSENPPSPLLDSLDNLHFNDNKEHHTVYRRITGSWYLFYYEGG